MNGSQPMGDGALYVRKAVTGSEAADISGDYNTYDTQDTLTVDGLDDKAMTAPSPDFPTSLLPGGSILSPFRCLLAAFAALAEALPSFPRSCEAAAQRAAPNRRRSPPPCPSPRRAPPILPSWGELAEIICTVQGQTAGEWESIISGIA